jgi:hypothetical protein
VDQVCCKGGGLCQKCYYKFSCNLMT